ncbi:MAG TPA: hypothetical protein PK175_07330 [Syntrophales bacterium]|nr:hypothetical protein [Syntrophales bacterium]HON23449.1 hypothetical protein [Syntrophales bacterium]HOU78526.1 hypothetical protein [Syntrophales bacterium]HPC33255.1 hypothetical protein [Syntrophales bacterium]HQG34663.1 hypothetical protein [Syntrophales bacterium]
MLASMKLIDLVENHAEKIAAQWSELVVKNPFTPFYHNKPAARLIPQAVTFYRNFRKLFMEPKPVEASDGYFSRYAEDRYREGVPLHEAVYALILMRRQIWLYAEFQATFSTAVERQQAIDSVTRTMLMFDYAMYFITKRYRELMKLEWFEAPNT